MKSIRDVGGEMLRWTPLNLAATQYVLRTEADLVASLQRESWLSANARGRTADGEWWFEAKGFWRRKTEIRRTDGVAELSSVWLDGLTGGRVHIDGHGAYRWRPANFWLTSWGMVDDSGKPLLTCRVKHVFFKGLHGQVRISPDAREAPGIGLLVLVGWYLAVGWNDIASG